MISLCCCCNWRDPPGLDEALLFTVARQLSTLFPNVALSFCTPLGLLSSLFQPEHSSFKTAEQHATGIRYKYVRVKLSTTHGDLPSVMKSAAVATAADGILAASGMDPDENSDRHVPLC